MYISEYTDRLENCWKIVSMGGGASPDTLETSQEEYKRLRAEIDYLRG